MKKEIETKLELPEKIANATFLLVGSGESYFTEVVGGRDIAYRMMVAMNGENIDDWPEGELEFWHNQICDLDNWCGNGDDHPTQYRTDVGETDHIDVIRLTHL